MPVRKQVTKPIVASDLSNRWKLALVVSKESHASTKITKDNS